MKSSAHFSSDNVHGWLTHSRVSGPDLCLLLKLSKADPRTVLQKFDADFLFYFRKFYTSRIVSTAPLQIFNVLKLLSNLTDELLNEISWHFFTFLFVTEAIENNSIYLTYQHWNDDKISAFMSPFLKLRFCHHHLWLYIFDWKLETLEVLKTLSVYYT